MDSETGLEESMWQLRLSPRDPPYPERPGEPDCSYYLRTGTCGYGERCRFNHPRDRSGVFQQAARGGRSGGGGYPERAGHAACKYYMKTGTCKYGELCKYDHPRREGGPSCIVALNCYGYPIRQGEKECSYYVRTGHCKFGSTCKFHHPESAPIHSLGPAFYQTVEAPTMDSWQVASPMVLPAPYMQPPYGSMVISSGVVPVQGWSPYPPTVSPMLSPGDQHSFPTGALFGTLNQLSPSAPAYAAISSAAGPSNSSQQEPLFPERPGQPDCQYYIRTGDCKFGSSCKYNHPFECRMPRTDCVLSPIGLPLRPGAQPCTYYAQHGVCKFGPTCKFDHHMGVLSYSPSASSLADMPVAPYPVGFSLATLAPSSSSSELRPDFTSKESFSTRIPSTESMPSGSVGSMFSKDGLPRPSLTQGQMSTPSRTSSMGQGGEFSSSS